jgi:hypothetical protein
MTKRSNSTTAERSRTRSPTPREILIPWVENWTFGTPQKNAENPQIQTIPLSVDGSSIICTIDEAFSPFELSSLSEGATRKSLTLRLSSRWDGAIDCMEASIMHRLIKEPETVFGCILTEDEVNDTYKPISMKKDNFPRNLRVKVNTTGSRKCRYWGIDKQRIDAPNHDQVNFNAKVHIRALWLGPDGWGLILDAADLQVQDAPIEECPF